MKNVIFFDGVCNMCNSLINFLIDIDKKDVLRFSPLQSKFAHSELKDYDVNLEQMKSVIYLKNDKIYFKSSAVLEIFKDLGRGYKLLYVFKFIIPRFIRDGIYNFIGNNRYKWFGKRDACRVPTKEVMKKFIE